jgi:riboflavin kinase
MILGFIRPEYDYVSKDALVEDIREDIRVAQRSLAREGLKGGEDTKINWNQAGQKDGVGMSQMMN